MKLRFSIVIVVALIGIAGWWWSLPNRRPTAQIEDWTEDFGGIGLDDLSFSSTPHPLSIDGIAQTDLGEPNLNQGVLHATESNYSSYLASYTSQGLRINGLLTIPAGEAPVGGWPVVVFLHGYIRPESYVTTERYSDYVHYLASRGLVVFKIDYRGHGDSEGEARGGYFSPDYVIDTLTAIKALQGLAHINPQRVGLWAHSMSGNVALRASVVNPDIKATVIWAGAVYSYTDLAELRLNDQSYRPPTDQQGQPRRSSQELIEEFGPISVDNPFWQAVAPTNYLDRLAANIQLHHATNDDVVSQDYSTNLAKLLESAQKSYELHLYPDGGHNLEGATFNAAMARTVEYYKKNL